MDELRRSRLSSNRLGDVDQMKGKNAMAEKILLVDDDSNVLDGYRRSLRGEFFLETALGGQQALSLAAANGPYAV